MYNHLCHFEVSIAILWSWLCELLVRDESAFGGIQQPLLIRNPRKVMSHEAGGTIVQSSKEASTWLWFGDLAEV
jgi:hypothetical protein